ncbi:MAG: hypothetical protein IKB70_08535 [Bacilli bacterium]|nr:hypothetical protein [Bacilli bacterium]
MAKIAMTKLGLIKNSKIKTIDFNSQKIEVKQYLPVEDKLNLISDIINSSVDENSFYNPCRLHIYQIVKMTMAYTNISFTDKQKEDIYKLYDLIVGSGLAVIVLNAIPADEYDFILEGTEETIQSIYSYRNSVMGILDNISADYSNLELDASKIQKDLADKENLTFLRDVLAQLG